MKRLHLQHQYLKWARNRVLPNPGDAGSKARRFLHYLFRTGEISQDERSAWLPYLAGDIRRLGWDKSHTALKLDKLVEDAKHF